MIESSPLTRRDLFARTATAAAALAAPQWLSQSAHAADEPAGWQIGIYTRPWAEIDYRAALDAMAAAGYKYAGLMTTASPSKLVISPETTVAESEQIGAEARQRGLTILSVWGGGLPVNESLQAGIDTLKRLIDNTAAAGGRSLLMGGVGDEKSFEPYYRAIAECCDYAAEKRVHLALKPHGGSNATGPQCRRCVEMVNHPSFRLWYDPGNIYFYSDGKLNPVDDAPSVAGVVTGMCVKDFSLSQVDGKPIKEVALTPGTGQVDFPAVMARLKQGGLTSGPLVIECLARVDTAQLVREAEKARRFVEQLVG
jgi:sugar phosphate isomerase/epimerase